MHLKLAGCLSTLTIVAVFAALTYQGTAAKLEPNSDLNSQPSSLDQLRSKRAADIGTEGRGALTRAQIRAAEKRQKQAAKQAERRANRLRETERRKAERAAARAERREADRILRAANRAATKETRQAARKARQDAKRAGGGRTVPTRRGGRDTYITLDNPQCLAAVTQCSLLDAVESEMMPQWERTRLKDEMKAAYKQRHDDLRRLKQYIVQLIDFTMKNPAADPLQSGLCDTYRNGGQQDPGKGTEDPEVKSPSDPRTKTQEPSQPWIQTTTGSEEGNARSSTTSDPWIKVSPTSDPFTAADQRRKTSTTADPWIKPFGGSDSWSRSSTAVDPRIQQSTTDDPWIKTSTTADPSVESSSTADPWIQSSETADPWVKISPSPVDPRIRGFTTSSGLVSDRRQSTAAAFPDPWTGSSETSAEPCTLGEWSQWSMPFGFGTQERRREITQPGAICPEAQLAVERRNVTSITEEGDNLTDDVGLVADNFRNDFIRASDGRPRDFLLVLDSSGSISDDDFEALKGGAELLIDSLCGGFGPAPNQHRLSVVQFSTFTRPVHSFAGSQDPAHLKSVVDSLGPLYGYTCTGDALKQAFAEFHAGKGARNYTTHDTLIITDGKSNCGSDIMSTSRELRKRSNVFALAVGLSADPGAVTEITSLVSQGDPRHLFSLANFRDFGEMVQRVRKKQEVDQCQPIIVKE